MPLGSLLYAKPDRSDYLSGCANLPHDFVDAEQEEGNHDDLNNLGRLARKYSARLLRLAAFSTGTVIWQRQSLENACYLHTTRAPVSKAAIRSIPAWR